MRLTWIHVVEIIWLVASLYLGSELTYWVGSSFFEHAFAILLAASPVWLSRLLIIVERRRLVLAGAAVIYVIGAVWFSSGLYLWAIRDARWIPIACAVAFAGLIFIHDRIRSRTLSQG